MSPQIKSTGSSSKQRKTKVYKFSFLDKLNVPIKVGFRAVEHFFIVS